MPKKVDNQSLVKTAKANRKTEGSGNYLAPDKAVNNAMVNNVNWREPDPEVTEMMRTNLEIRSWAKIDMRNPDEVENRINLYFQTIAQHGMKPTIAGLSLALGTSRVELYRITHEATTKPREVITILQNATQFINSLMEDFMLNGKTNPVAGIFLMKNNFGYRDQAEVIVKPVNPYGEQKDPDELAKKYLESMPDVIEAEVVEEGQKVAESENPV